MIALIQRVSEASVSIENYPRQEIACGLVVLLGVEKGDAKQQADKLINKVLKYRLFEDGAGKMNKSLLDTKGDLLIVSQFTLAARTDKGLRPGFDGAASPDEAQVWYNYFVDQCQKEVPIVKTGVFAADMNVSLVNDGPVTFWLQT